MANRFSLTEKKFSELFEVQEGDTRHEKTVAEQRSSEITIRCSEIREKLTEVMTLRSATMGTRITHRLSNSYKKIKFISKAMPAITFKYYIISADLFNGKSDIKTMGNTDRLIFMFMMRPRLRLNAPDIRITNLNQIVLRYVFHTPDHYGSYSYIRKPVGQPNWNHYFRTVVKRYG